MIDTAGLAGALLDVVLGIVVGLAWLVWREHRKNLRQRVQEVVDNDAGVA